MTPFLIVLALLALAVGIVLWATRHTPARPARPAQPRPEPDTPQDEPTAPADAAATDPFASAPPREEPRS